MAEDNSSQDSIEQINKRLDYLESISRETIARLYSIEVRLGMARRPANRAATAPEPDHRSIAGSKMDAAIEAKPYEPSVPLPAITDVSRPESVEPPPLAPPPHAAAESRGPKDAARQPLPRDRRAPSMPVTQGPPPASTQARRSPAARRSVPAIAQARSKSSGDLEALIGGSWFNRIGIIAIAIGVAFFLKYAFDNQWIGPWGRVLIGAAIGIGFLIGGERLRPRYQNYAYGLTGGGVLILYLSIYATHAFFSEPLIGQLPAFACMVIVTALASLLSARYSALPVAFLGLIGGFLTPILLSTGVDNEVGLFTYVALLDVGVLALAYSKQWRSLNYSAFVATVLMFAAWTLEWYAQEKLWMTVFFLTLFFIIFSMLAVLYNVVNRRQTEWVDLSLVFANGLLYFSSSYVLLEGKYRGGLGLFAVLVSAFYLALSYLTYSRDREDRLLLYTFLGLSFLFAVLAVPIQFKQHWLTMGWAVEGAVMTWVGLRVNDRTSRYAALVVFLIAATHWVSIDAHDFAYQVGETFVPLLNRRALSCAVFVAALAASAMFYKRDSHEIDREERSMFTGLYVLGANVLAVTLLTLDANDYFTQLAAGASGRAGGAGNFGSAEAARQIDNAHQFTLSVLWIIYGTTALIVGVMRRLKPLRAAAWLLIVITTVKVLLVDLKYYDAHWHTLIFNQTFAAFALLVAALAAIARFYGRNDGIEKGERDLFIPLIIGVANLLAIIAFSAEAAGYFDRARAVAPSQVASPEDTKQLALSAIWAVYATVALALGVIRESKMLRWGALSLLTLVTVKVLAVDLKYYDAAWHTPVFNQTFAAFALLIVAMSVGIWLYSRAETVNEEERASVIPLMVAAANLLAIIALSAEAYGYYAKSIEASGTSAADPRDLRLAQQLSLSVIWTVYGGAMLAAGIVRRNRMLRMMALGLLGLTIVKVFLIDLSSLEKIYRIVSFIVLGAILLAVSFLYQRYRQRMAGLIDEPGAQAPANVNATNDGPMNEAPANME